MTGAFGSGGGSGVVCSGASEGVERVSECTRGRDKASCSTKHRDGDVELWFRKQKGWGVQDAKKSPSRKLHSSFPESYKYFQASTPSPSGPRRFDKIVCRSCRKSTLQFDVSMWSKRAVWSGGLSEVSERTHLGPSTSMLQSIVSGGKDVVCGSSFMQSSGAGNAEPYRSCLTTPLCPSRRWRQERERGRGGGEGGGGRAGGGRSGVPCSSWR